MKKFTIAVMLICIQLALFPFSGPPDKLVLRAGIAKVDITPAETLYMGGYDESCRSGPSDGNDGSLYARALVFDDTKSRIAFIEVDVVSLPKDEYSSIRKLISSSTGIPFDNIMLGCVHNHAAPYYGEKNSKSDWHKQFKGNILKAVKDAISDLEPVKTGGGTGRSNIAMNRRKRMQDTLSLLTFDENNASQSYGKFRTDNPVKIREMEGVIRLGANPGGPIDDEVGVMRIDRVSGQPKAVFINYACHGTSLGARNNTISPEWNGHMLAFVEKEIPGVTAIFIQGAAGDINPRFVGGLDGYRDNLQHTAELGYEIGREVVRVFDGIMPDFPIDPEIRIVNQDIVCPLSYSEVVKDFRRTTIGVPTTAIRIDQFAWVTFPGELFHEIGKTIKSDTHARYSFLVGYCNGSLGYLPTRTAFSEGGYEPWSSRFDPAAGIILVKGVEQLLIRIP
jgi:neutral ceramidase